MHSFRIPGLLLLLLLAVWASAGASAAPAPVPNKAVRVLAKHVQNVTQNGRLTRGPYMYVNRRWVLHNSSAAVAHRLAAQKCCCNECALSELPYSYTSKRPYSSIALVQFSVILDGDYASTECTATLIGPRVMLTAGHCVSDDGLTILSGYAYFGVYQSKYSGPAIPIVSWSYWIDWRDYGKFKADQAVLLLQYSPGSRYAASSYSDYSKVRGYRSVMSLGFPHFEGTPFDINELRYSTTKYATFAKFTSNRLSELTGTYTFPLAIGGGMSGGPVFDMSNYAIVATNDWSVPSLFGCSQKDSGCYNGYTPVDNIKYPIATLIRTV